MFIINKDDFTYHMKAMRKVLKKPDEVGLKINAEKLSFVQTETKYLGLWVSKNGVRSLSSK